MKSPIIHGAPRVFGYCRVSTVAQVDEGVSLDEQQRRITGRAIEQGWQIAEMFVEEGVSGSVRFDDRPQGGRLARELQSGDIVIAAKLDRMFRSAADALNVIASFQQRGISLWLLDLGGDVSGNGIARLMMTVLAAVAEFERDRIGERIRDAKAHQRADGKFLGGVRPYGWRINDRRELVPDPAEQATIDEMAKLHSQGLSFNRIAIEMRKRHTNITRPTVQKALARRAAEREREGEE